MAARVIIIGRNSALPRDAAQALGGFIAPRFPAAWSRQAADTSNHHHKQEKAMTTYDWWQNALKGKFGPIHDGDPQPGFYRARNKGGTDDPVAIWWNGEQMLAIRKGAMVDASDIWTFVCERPITEEVYRAVAERGQPWPDAIPDLPVSNSAMFADEVEQDEIQSAIEAALAELREPVEDQAHCDRIANHRDRLLKLFKTQEEKRKAEKQPHTDAAKAVDEKFKPILARIEEAGHKLRDALTVYLRKVEERAKREAAERAATEAEMPVPITQPKAGTTGRSTALRSYKVAEINDYAAALNHFSQHPEVKAAVQKLCDQCARSEIAVPGMTIKTEKRAA